MPDAAREIVFNSCLHDNGDRYDLHAVVVMPDHVHMILIPLVDKQNQRVWGLPEILDAIKGASAHLINKKLGRRGTVWQQESSDHVLRSSESLGEKTQYLINNPVRRGLVDSSAEYAWLWSAPFTNPYAPNRA